jgi:pimeloyl-ACP methyl ester carboxylesterase
MKVPLLLALALALGAPAFAADLPQAPNRFAATINPAERFEVGALLVERHGQRGRPLVLIPGLASGAWVWQDMIRELSAEHVLYVVTLPGFDGRAPIDGNALDAARAALLELIATRKLDKPVLVGHSLGGMLALRIAEERPNLVGGVVTIDGLPAFPGSEAMPAEERAKAAEAMKARVPLNREAFAAQQQQYMRGVGVLDMGKADELAKLTARSDPAAVARYIGDALGLGIDLRQGLPTIAAPVLVMAPYFEPDASQHGITAPAMADYYRSVMAGVPKVEVLTVAPARHFAMFDQPREVADAIRRYLNSL